MDPVALLIWLLMGQALCLGAGVGLGYAIGVRVERGRAARFAEMLELRRPPRRGLRLVTIHMRRSGPPNP